MNNNESYSRETIDAKLDSILLRISEVKDIATATHEQATKTNGRVNSLESWKARLIGSVAIIGVLTSLIVYVYITEQARQNEQLHELAQKLK